MLLNYGKNKEKSVEVNPGQVVTVTAINQNVIWTGEFQRLDDGCLILGKITYYKNCGNVLGWPGILTWRLTNIAEIKVVHKYFYTKVHPTLRRVLQELCFNNGINWAISRFEINEKLTYLFVETEKKRLTQSSRADYEQGLDEELVSVEEFINRVISLKSPPVPELTINNFKCLFEQDKVRFADFVLQYTDLDKLHALSVEIRDGKYSL